MRFAGDRAISLEICRYPAMRGTSLGGSLAGQTSLGEISDCAEEQEVEDRSNERRSYRDV